MDIQNPIIQSFIANLVSSFTSEVTAFLENKIKNWKDVYFNSNIADYLNSMNNKFSMTKTFLYRNNPEDFRKRYFNVLLRSKDVGNFLVTNIDEFFRNNNFISIISSAGSGKTMFVKNVFIKTLEQKNKKIPIEITLRDLKTEENCIEKNILDKLKIDKDVLNILLEKGKFLFLLDGYDEISIQNNEFISRQIVNFTDKFHKNYFLITSRPGAGLESIPRFKEFTIKELDISQIKEFITIQIDDKNFQNKLISIINNNLNNRTIIEYLKNPLLLSMFIFTFKSYPEIPKSRSQFYWNVYDTLCNKHDSITKFGGYQHERKSELKNEDITKILEWFAYKSFFENKFSFNEQYLVEKLTEIKNKLNFNTDIKCLIYDLTVSLSIIIKDGLEYKFPHKTLQEYFVVRLIKDLNEKSKEKIYSEIIPKRLVFYSNISFFDLCEEIDNICFKKFFVIKIFTDFLSKTDENDSDIEKCKSFLKYIKGFTQNYIIRDLKKNEIQQTGYSVPSIEGGIISIVTCFSLKQVFHSTKAISKEQLFNLTKEIGIDINIIDENIIEKIMAVTKNSKIAKFSYEKRLCYDEKVINHPKLEGLLNFTGLKTQILNFIKIIKMKLKK